MTAAVCYMRRASESYSLKGLREALILLYAKSIKDIICAAKEHHYAAIARE